MDGRPPTPDSPPSAGPTRCRTCRRGAPTRRASISLDYLHWNITNEVNQQSTDQLLITENQCRQGTLDISSPSCVAALAQVVRDSFENIVSISTPKINVSNETVNAFVAEGRYGMDLAQYGSLEFQAAWTDILTHTIRVYPGDPTIDSLADPTEPNHGTDFKSKINGSVTWKIQKWSSTIFADRHGASPNYAATLQGGYANPGAGSLIAARSGVAPLDFKPVPLEQVPEPLSRAIQRQLEKEEWVAAILRVDLDDELQFVDRFVVLTNARLIVASPLTTTVGATLVTTAGGSCASRARRGTRNSSSTTCATVDCF
jgi:hypothetical protein